MLVGEVRWATTGCGVSWKLSGGNPLLSAATNVVKYLHVRRATRRRIRTSPGGNATGRAAMPGTLTQRAIAGDRAQSVNNGHATRHAPGDPHSITTAPAMARRRPPAMRR